MTAVLPVSMPTIALARVKAKLVAMLTVATARAALFCGTCVMRHRSLSVKVCRGQSVSLANAVPKQ